MALLGNEDKPLKVKTKTFLGKGSKQRPYNVKKYQENFDRIFNKNKKKYFLYA